MSRELAIPARERVGGSRSSPQPRQKRVSLNQRAPIGHTCLAPGRPERCHERVEMGPPLRRGSFHDLQPIGHEDAYQRALVEIDETLPTNSVDLEELRPAGLEPD